VVLIINDHLQLGVMEFLICLELVVMMEVELETEGEVIVVVVGCARDNE